MADAAPLTYTVEEAAALLGISRGLAYDLVRRGEIVSVQLGRRLVVPRARLLAMLDATPTNGQALPRDQRPDIAI